jgi:hypothetical protein
MKTLVFFSLFAGLLAFSASTMAQNAVTKINSTAGTINSAAAGVSNVNNAVGNTGNAVKGAATTVQQVGTMFKKKDKAPEAASEPSSNGVLIHIAGIDYPGLKQMEDEINKIEGVKETSKKFSTNGSTIGVKYTGQDDELWDALPESIKSSLTLLDLGDGKIVLKK